MAKVFVSHASEDLYFVSLLEALLKFHYVDVWSSSSQIEPGAPFPQRIQAAIKESNLLLVVASANTARSKWVVKELTQFQTEKPDGRIAPLRLDLTDLETISPGLSDYQAIDFSKSMLSGYENLFFILGKSFLSYADRRNVPLDRRLSSERRAEDRRTRMLMMRLRRGFTKTYFEQTRRSEFDILNAHGSIDERARVIYCLAGEVEKYAFSYGDGPRHAKDVLDEMTYRVWDRMERQGPIKAVYLIEAIAEEMFHCYEVTLVSDRRHQDRRSESGRRKSRAAGA